MLLQPCPRRRLFLPLITPQQYLGSVKDDQQGGDECHVSVTTDTSRDTFSNAAAAGSCVAISTAAVEEILKPLRECSTMK